MVVEKLFQERWVEKRPIYSFFLGIIFTLIAFITSRILFNGASTIHMVGITTILFTVIVALPGVNKLFDIEEKKEARGKQSFLKEHEEVFDFFLYFFFGVFVVFFVISFISPDLVMGERLMNFQEEKLQIAEKTTDTSGVGGPPTPPAFLFEDNGFKLFNNQVKSIFLNNIYIMTLCFVLSILYGSGALFLLIFNASVWAAKLAEVIMLKIPDIANSATIYTICNIGVISIHMIPEITAYILAAIGGGVLSKAFTKEKFMSSRFKKVFKDSFILMLASFVVVFISAILEVHISKDLFENSVCGGNQTIYILIGILLICAFIGFEMYRNKHHRKKKKIYK
jgi:uncharacterized membrane protein SpoIIM required for sporulation